MTIPIPEPVAFAAGGHPNHLCSRAQYNSMLGKSRIKFDVPLITTTQAEAYADARVAESQRWVSVDERLPDVGVPVLVYIPPGPDCHPSDVNIRFDFICPDYEYWHNHSEHYEHYCCVAKGGSGIEWSGPSEKAPYTHWMPLPAPPLPGPVEPSKENT